MQQNPINMTSPVPMRLVYSSEGTAVYKPVILTPTPTPTPTPPSSSARTGSAPAAGRGGSGGESSKRKRGRPRKYGPDGSMVLAVVSVSSPIMPPPVPPMSGTAPASSPVVPPLSGTSTASPTVVTPFSGTTSASSAPVPALSRTTSALPDVAPPLSVTMTALPAVVPPLSMTMTALSAVVPPPSGTMTTLPAVVPPLTGTMTALPAVVPPTSRAGGTSGGFPTAMSPPMTASLKKGKGRPVGSVNKQQLAVFGSSGIGITPYIITVQAGEDVSSKIMSFPQHGPQGICILSANGAVSNVTLRQSSTSGGTVTYEGRFEILSLSGSYLLSESGGQRSRTGGLSVSLAGPDGRVLGGGVAGLLTAASPVQVVIGSFVVDAQRELKSNPSDPSAPPNISPVGAPVTSSPPSRGTLSESSDGPGSPPNHNAGTCNNSPHQGMFHMPWK